MRAMESGEIRYAGYLYQATDRIADVILDLHAIFAGETESLGFLERVE